MYKGGKNTEGYADSTATIAIGRVTKEEKKKQKQNRPHKSEKRRAQKTVGVELKKHE